MIAKRNITTSIIKIFIVLFAFIGTQNIVYSQKPQHTEEITIIGSYKPSIQDAYRINSNPIIDNDEQKMPRLTYKITSTKVNALTTPETLDHERTIREPKQKLYGNYIKLGFGNYKTPYLEFFANTLQSSKFALGVHLKHLSSLGEIKNHPFSTFSNSTSNISGKRFFKHHTLSGEIFYKHDVVHFYNLTQNIFDSLGFKEDNIRQRFQLAGLNLGFTSNYFKKGKLNHSFDLNYYYLTDYYSTSEQRRYFKSDINTHFELFNSGDLQKIGIHTEVVHYTNNDSVNNNIISKIARVRPYIKAEFGQYKLYFRLNTAIKLDSVTKINLFPVIKAEVEVIPKTLTAFIGTKGNIYRNDFKTLYEKNPFISSVIPLEYSKNKFEVYGGIMGNIENTVNYSIMISSANIENMPFFVNDTSVADFDKFTLVYDTANIIHFNGEISYQSKENLRILFKADYYSFDLNSELEPWYRSQFEASIGVNTIVLDKIVLKAALATHSKMYSKTYELGVITTKEIDGWVDINFGAEYRFSQKFSVFVDLNNVMNSQYKKWDNYPLQKFNFLGGITYSF
ncbi:MAG: TonB-dependent receptor [Bacteroidales bacterium]|nr:TonB-dependent receptor [Bacteroidales bacterium]